MITTAADRAVAGARRWQRRIVLAQVLLLLILVGGVVYVTDSVVGGSLFRDPMRVTVHLQGASGLHPKSVVTYRGQRIGEVTSVRLVAPGEGGEAPVVAELALDEDARVPLASDFWVRNLSAVGEQYLDVRPRTVDGPYVEDGTVVAVNQTSLPLSIDTILARAQSLMDGIDTADITTIGREVQAAFGGDAVDLRALAIGLEDALDLFVALEADFDRIVTRGAVPLRALDDLGPQLRTLTRDLAAVSATLRAAEPDIRRLLVRGTDLLPRLDAWWRELDPDLRRLLRTAVSPAEMSADHLRGLHEWLDWAPLQADAMAGSTRDGSGRVLLVPRFLKNCIYEPNRQRDLYDISDRRLSTDAQCTDPNPKVQARGSRNVPDQ
ncbi:MlaD family protein [Nocardioides massiliensis]|uniref:Phospholipid/cholesterol/gamma-HCH transport system substrate-binding protein n=1 Tax=Nocardioides massiliensis TaxID=1325935 RepID=A0ABT9NPJ5_9ACTN|nr:MlaD family protein [Nocardioides massiliensis]MDP9822352.1 phospholipid/cholesterol/gamma-HCH transport system substrate-binding protein [Nocardioides massiliensis]